VAVWRSITELVLHRGHEAADEADVSLRLRAQALTFYTSCHLTTKINALPAQALTFYTGYP